jgi:hypothetical protein
VLAAGSLFVLVSVLFGLLIAGLTWPVVGAASVTAKAEKGLSSSRDALLTVPRPPRRRVPRRPLQVPKRLPWPSPNPHRRGTLSFPLTRVPSRRCRLRITLRTDQLLHPSTNRQLTMSEHKMIEAMVAQDQPSAEEEFLTAIETCCCE